MTIQDRDYIRGNHPPNCSCAECTNKRLKRIRGGSHENYISNWPRFGRSSLRKRVDNIRGQKGYLHRPHIPNWLKALLLIVILSVVGLVASRIIGSLIPFWLLFVFSILFSIEKWLGYYTRRHRIVGRVYRLILNLSALSLLGLLTWSGVLLFTQQFIQSPLMGSLLFIGEFAAFIWLCRVVSRNNWRKPSMKLTVFSLICLFLVFSFAGVQPLSNYQDSLFNAISTYFRNASQPDTTPMPSDTTPFPSDTTSSPSNEINSHTGKYENYYLGLVDTPGGYLSGNGCYDDTGDFIVLINNENAVNPSYTQLVDFLRQDNTDEFPYIYAINPPGIYYGTPESHVDLIRIQGIIEGTEQPDNPHVCGDFAERLHNNAELAGIRCAYVSISLGDTGHACNAFQTDRGLVYIDCTGTSDSYGPDSNDTIVDIQVGKQYNPEYLFPSGGWYIPTGTMGTVTDFQVVWDGSWND